MKCFTFTRLFLDLVVQATMHASPFFNRSAEATFENFLVISVFELCFYFRQAMRVVSTAGKQHVFLQADLEAASKKSSHLAEALKSVNEELASIRDDWTNKVGGIQTVVLAIFCELNCNFLQVLARNASVTIDSYFCSCRLLFVIMLKVVVSVIVRIGKEL